MSVGGDVYDADSRGGRNGSCGKENGEQEVGEEKVREVVGLGLC